jgi:hypothetical protein
MTKGNLYRMEFLCGYFYVYLFKMLAKIHSTETVCVKSTIDVIYICFKCVFTPQLEVLIRLLSLSLVLPLRAGYIRLVYSVR